jgi:hypothetical protein
MGSRTSQGRGTTRRFKMTIVTIPSEFLDGFMLTRAYEALFPRSEPVPEEMPALEPLAGNSVTSLDQGGVTSLEAHLLDLLIQPASQAQEATPEESASMQLMPAQLGANVVPLMGELVVGEHHVQEDGLALGNIGDPPAAPSPDPQVTMSATSSSSSSAGGPPASPGCGLFGEDHPLPAPMPTSPTEGPNRDSWVRDCKEQVHDGKMYRSYPTSHPKYGSTLGNIGFPSDGTPPRNFKTGNFLKSMGALQFITDEQNRSKAEGGGGRGGSGKKPF